MPVFKYKAIDNLGKNQKGNLEAVSQQEAIKMLQKKNYFVVSLDSVDKQAPSPVGDFLKKIDLFQTKLSDKKRVDFTRQFASLLKTGVPYHRSLQILLNGEKDKYFRGILNQIYEEILEGKSLAMTLKQFPNDFSSIYVALVQAGEVGGNLGDLMQKQADFDAKQLKIQTRVRNALLYPLIMCFVALGIIVFMIKFILPKIIPIFDHFDTVLPLPTRIVIFLSNLISNYGWLTFSVFFVILISIKFYLRTDKGKLQYDTFSLKIPAYSNFLRKILNYRLVQVIATLMSSGVDLKNTLQISEKITGNSFYEKSIHSLSKEVTQKGFSLSQGMQRVKLLSEALIQTIKVGEESGTLPQTLEQSAENLEIELESALNKYVSLLEPMVILVMALFVGFIILSVLLPMFQLNQLV